MSNNVSLNVLFQENYYDYHQKEMIRLKKINSEEKERVIKEEREKMTSFQSEKVDFTFLSVRFNKPCKFSYLFLNLSIIILILLFVSIVY